MKTETAPIESLLPDPSNVREHDERNVEAIKASLLRFGQQKPIVVDSDGVVIAGNGTLGAAKMLGWTSLEVVRTELAGAEAVAYAIADNRTAELADWDETALALVLEQLETPLLEAAGFDEKELGELITRLDPTGGEVEEVEAQTDKAEELNEKWKVKRGDLWQIGEHRLLCGDATSEEDAFRVVDGARVGMTFTSPPYNANTRFTNIRNSGKLYEGYDDNLDSDSYIQLASSALGVCFSVTDGFIFWNVNYNTNARFEFILQLLKHIRDLDEVICWKKTALPVPAGLTRTWEPIFVFKTSDERRRIGTLNKTEFNFWEVSNSGCLSSSHRAAFPVELVKRAAVLCGSESLFDPFLGSGTTMVASEQLNRKCYGMEIEPKYCAVILERMADMGLEPSRIENE